MVAGTRVTWGERKVRAPQDRVIGNTDRPQGPGKCSRKQTALRRALDRPLPVNHMAIDRVEG